jgi:hypothetical protein
LGPSTSDSSQLPAPVHSQRPATPTYVAPTTLGPSASDSILLPAPVHLQRPAFPTDVAPNGLGATRRILAYCRPPFIRNARLLRLTLRLPLWAFPRQNQLHCRLWSTRSARLLRLTSRL